MKQKIIQFFKTKGYYMVLALSVLTVGTVSFLSYRSSQKEEAQTPLTQEETQNVEKVEEDVPDQRQEVSEAPAKQEPQVAPLSYNVPLEGEIIGHYSPEQPVYSYTLKDWRTHCGIDIAAPEGTQVLATADGVIESVAQDDLMGLLLTLRHPDGKLSRYASLATATAQEGQMVKQGDPLGTVGRSMLLECGETHHLHYELWENDQPTDPTFMWKK